MEMHERIKFLRNDMRLTQEAFGNRLAVSRDMVNNLERGRVDIKEHIIKLICAEFSVNEDWLRSGSGSIFIEPDTFSLDTFVKNHGMTDFELDIVKAYFELDPEIRNAVVSHFRNRLIACTAEPEDLWSDSPDTSEELERQFPPVPKRDKGVG